jgi:gamma-glutamylcyclotransferase (GGCT)/AIG2-like uncharacterized protein YtfP
MPKVFVYSTLENPKTRSDVIGKAKVKHAAAKAVKKAVKTDKGHGYKTIKPGKKTVQGEVLTVSKKQLKKLDNWESHYKRKPVQLKNGKKVDAYEWKK